MHKLSPVIDIEMSFCQVSESNNRTNCTWMFWPSRPSVTVDFLSTVEVVLLNKAFMAKTSNYNLFRCYVHSVNNSLFHGHPIPCNESL